MTSTSPLPMSPIPRIIDAHLHLRSASDLPLLQNQLTSISASAAIVIGTPVLGQPWKKSGFENLPLANLLQNHPNLFPVYTADMRTPDAAPSELDQLAEIRPPVAVKIFPGDQPFYPDDSRMDGLYRYLSKHEIPLMVHTGDTYRQGAKVKYARPVFVDRVAADFPNLKIVLCHLGNPWFADAAEVMSKNPNVMGGIDGLLTSEISPRYADYLDFLRRSLLDLFAFIGDIEDRFFFGSDWPVATPLQCLELINLLSLTKSERDNLLFSAAQKFYGLPDTISG